MFDPSEYICGGKWGYIVRHCRNDYIQGSPLAERLNPLRYTIGLGRARPCRIVVNRDAKLQRLWSDLNWRLWKRRIRAWREGKR